ncbi:hypothetical protein SNEBB_003584 [Seison nebaliae]|nr:hypothetical protein SNEBB_003584 [Seison nebaliae]
MSVRATEAHKALELIEDYAVKLANHEEHQLRTNLEKLVRLFKSKLFQALVEMYNFYDVILLDENVPLSKKVQVSQSMIGKWNQKDLLNYKNSFSGKEKGEAILSKSMTTVTTSGISSVATNESKTANVQMKWNEATEIIDGNNLNEIKKDEYDYCFETELKKPEATSSPKPKKEIPYPKSSISIENNLDNNESIQKMNKTSSKNSPAFSTRSNFNSSTSSKSSDECKRRNNLSERSSIIMQNIVALNKSALVPLDKYHLSLDEKQSNESENRLTKSHNVYTTDNESELMEEDPLKNHNNDSINSQEIIGGLSAFSSAVLNDRKQNKTIEPTLPVNIQQQCTKQEGIPYNSPHNNSLQHHPQIDPHIIIPAYPHHFHETSQSQVTNWQLNTRTSIAPHPSVSNDSVSGKEEKVICENKLNFEQSNPKVNGQNVGSHLHTNNSSNQNNTSHIDSINLDDPINIKKEESHLHIGEIAPSKEVPSTNDEINDSVQEERKRVNVSSTDPLLLDNSKDEKEDNSEISNNNSRKNKNSSKFNIASKLSEHSQQFAENMNYQQQLIQIWTESGWEYEVVQLNKNLVNGLGFSIAGGVNHSNPFQNYDLAENEGLIYITKIIPGGCAAIDGRLCLNDILVSVNNVSCINVPRSVAVDTLRQAPPSQVQLLVKRIRTNEIVQPIELWPTVFEMQRYAERNDVDLSMPLLDPRAKFSLPTPSLGFSIGTAPTDNRDSQQQQQQQQQINNQVVITRLIPNGLAEYDGQLQPGDRILAANGINLQNTQQNQSVEVLKGVVHYAYERFLEKIDDETTFDFIRRHSAHFHMPVVLLIGKNRMSSIRLHHNKFSNNNTNINNNNNAEMIKNHNNNTNYLNGNIPLNNDVIDYNLTSAIQTPINNPQQNQMVNAAPQSTGQLYNDNVNNQYDLNPISKTNERTLPMKYPSSNYLSQLDANSSSTSTSIMTNTISTAMVENNLKKLNSEKKLDGESNGKSLGTLIAAVDDDEYRQRQLYNMTTSFPESNNFNGNDNFISQRNHHRSMGMLLDSNPKDMISEQRKDDEPKQKFTPTIYHDEKDNSNPNDVTSSSSPNMSAASDVAYNDWNSINDETNHSSLTSPNSNKEKTSFSSNYNVNGDTRMNNERASSNKNNMLESVELRRLHPTKLPFVLFWDDKKKCYSISKLRNKYMVLIDGNLSVGDKVHRINGEEITNIPPSNIQDIIGEMTVILKLFVEHKGKDVDEYKERIIEPIVSWASMGSLKTSQKRSFYVKTLFDYDPGKDAGIPGRGLSFHYGDILHVTNAADIEWWQAKRVLNVIPDDNQLANMAVGGNSSYDNSVSSASTISSNSSLTMGIIPSAQRVERKEKARRRRVGFKSGHNKSNNNINNNSNTINMNGNLNGNNNNNCQTNGNDEETKTKTKKSTFGSRFTLSLSRKSQQNLLDEPNNTNEVKNQIEDPNDNTIMSYEIVTKQSCMIQPIIILGAMRDQLNDDLIASEPYKFRSCIPHTTRPKREDELHGKDYYFVNSREKMEEDIANLCFIEAGQFKGNLYGTSLQSVENVIQQNKHAVLDVSGHAIRRLQAAMRFPISIYIKPTSVSSLLKLNNRLKSEDARKQYRQMLNLEQEFGSSFSAILNTDMEYPLLLRTTKAIIHNLGNQQAMWIPTSPTSQEQLQTNETSSDKSKKLISKSSNSKLLAGEVTNAEKEMQINVDKTKNYRRSTSKNMIRNDQNGT